MYYLTRLNYRDMKKVLIYVRTSKVSQEYDRQVSDLTEHSIKMGYEVIDVITEQITGSAKIGQRIGLQKVIQLAEQKKYDKLLVSEISRLGRTTEVHRIIEMLSDLKVSIYIHNYSMETLDNNLKPNSMIGFMLTILSEFSRIEKETLIQRINSGLEQARRDGKQLGRRKDSCKSKAKYLSEYKGVVRLVKKNLSLRDIAALSNVSVNTARKVKLLMAS